MPQRGGCLCGNVRYRIDGPILAINACHCRDCKRTSGVTHAVYLHTQRGGLVQESGNLARYRKRADSGREIDLVRCASCATRLWHEPLAAPQLVFVAAGTLDVSDWVVPTSHIWAASRAPSIQLEPDALIIEGAPDDRQALWDRFKQLYA